MSNLGSPLRNRIASYVGTGSPPAALSGPLQLRFGASADSTGVTGEPAQANGYTRPSIPFANILVSGNVLTINVPINLGPFVGNLGTMNAVGLYDNAGIFLAFGLLSGALVFTGTPQPIAAGQITLTIV